MLKLMIVGVLFVATSGDVADYVQVCRRSDPQVSRCIRKNVEVLRPKLAGGIPELHVPPLEPLELPNIVISGGNDAASYKAIGKRVKVFGASRFQVNKLKADIPNLTFYIGVGFPFLRFFADVDVNARVFLSPIKAKAKLEANTTNVVGNAIVKMDTYNDQGVEKMRFAMDLDLNTSDLSIRVTDLLADEFIGQIVREVLSQNQNEIFQYIKPVAQETAARVISEMVNNITRNFSYDEIFPK